LTQSTKESLNFIRKYRAICENNPKFEKDFMIYFEEKIIDYQRKNITAEELDESVSDYLDNYLISKRDKALKSILREKK